MRINLHDHEGRLITLEYKDFYLVTVYVPNAKQGLERLPYRMQWEEDFKEYVTRLKEDKMVIICGDFNIEICQYIGLLDTEKTFRDFEVEIRNSFYKYSTSIREILDKYYFRENTSNATGEINNVDQAFFESIKQFQKRIQDDIKS